MKVCIKKEDLQTLRNARDFGRTIQVEVSSFRRYEDENKEVEVELIETKEETITKSVLKKSINKCFDVYNQYNVKVELLKELGLEEK
jgi:cell division FtsZ-interacting protein ZapD